MAPRQGGQLGRSVTSRGGVRAALGPGSRGEAKGRLPCCTGWRRRLLTKAKADARCAHVVSGNDHDRCRTRRIRCTVPTLRALIRRRDLVDHSIAVGVLADYIDLAVAVAVGATAGRLQQGRRFCWRSGFCLSLPGRSHPGRCRGGGWLPEGVLELHPGGPTERAPQRRQARADEVPAGSAAARWLIISRTRFLSPSTTAACAVAAAQVLQASTGRRPVLSSVTGGAGRA